MTARRPDTAGLQRAALIGGLAALALAGLCLLRWPTAALHAALVSYLWLWSITLGCLGLLLLQHRTGGAWGLVVRRVCEAAAGTLPLLLLLFVPLVVGGRRLYPWLRPGAAADAVLAHQRAYLNLPFFLVRAALCFAAWGALAAVCVRLSRRMDEADDAAAAELAGRLRRLAGPGLVVYGLTVSVAAIDWIMSLAAGWYSTIFGLIVIAGQGLGALAFCVVVLVPLARRPPLRGQLQPDHLHALGKLLLAFVMLWAYTAYAQLLLIWIGNLPDETSWYAHRLHSGWRPLGVVLLVLHFALPFALLLSRDLKRRGVPLLLVAALVLLLRGVDQAWLTLPELPPGEAGPGAVVAWIAVAAGSAALWLALFLRGLRRAAVLPRAALHGIGEEAER